MNTDIIIPMNSKELLVKDYLKNRKDLNRLELLRMS